MTKEDHLTHHQNQSFFDVPFPLHPEKTFRIHSTPLIGSPLLNGGSTAGSVVSMDSSTTPDSVPTTSTATFTVPPPTTPTTTTTANAAGSPGPRNVTPSPGRGVHSPTRVKFSPQSSPRRRMSAVKLYNDSDKYNKSFNSTTSPSTSPLNKSLSTYSPSHSSPSSSSSPMRSQWSREDNYSTICSPSSSPLLGSSSRASSPGIGSTSPTSYNTSPRKRSGYTSPVAVCVSSFPLYHRN